MNAREQIIKGTPYRVVDANGYRLLLVSGNNKTAMSIMPLSTPDALVPYTAAMLMPLPFFAQLKDIVLIGLGGGQQAKFIHNRLLDTRLVALEIDPAIVRIARSHFKLPPNDARLSVLTEDGGAYIHAHPNSCDLILSDGYDQTFTMDSTLVGESFYQACHRALRPGGMMAINLLGKTAAWRATHLRMVRSIFSMDIQLEIAERQFVLLLAKELLHEDVRVLAKRANELEARLDLGLPRFVQRFDEERRAASDKQQHSLVITGLRFRFDTLLTPAA